MKGHVDHRACYLLEPNVNDGKSLQFVVYGQTTNDDNLKYITH